MKLKVMRAIHVTTWKKLKNIELQKNLVQVLLEIISQQTFQSM